MDVAMDRRLYVSTDKGLFQARWNGGGYEAQPLAFDRYTPMRWPVVVDCDNPRRPSSCGETIFGSRADVSQCRRAAP